MKENWEKFKGQVFQDKFPLQKLLGGTSYGAVFLTQSPPPEPKPLAIKFISSPAKADADSQAALFQRASQLTHANLLRLLPGGPCRFLDMDLAFVLMEYAEEDLGRGLSDRALSEKEAREMLESLLDALSYLHSKGFAHSHIKPSNLMAIGKQLKLSSEMVLPLGEPRPAYRPLDAYDAPEAGSAPVAPASDVWSLGVTLLEVLAQQKPVSSLESQDDPEVPSTIAPPFFDIARNCLRRDPQLRWTIAQIKDGLNPAPLQVAVAAAASAAMEPKIEPRVELGKENPTPTQVAAPAVVTVNEEIKIAPVKEMWVDSDYFWVVVCKNHWFHGRGNFATVHRIPLGETDPVLPRPKVDRAFTVRCDECGKEYTYQPSEVLKYEMEVPAPFAAHPLFRDSLEPDKTGKDEPIPSPQPRSRKQLVRTLEWAVGGACLVLIAAQFVLINLPKLSADVSSPSQPKDPGAMFRLYNKGSLPVYDVKAGCEVTRVDLPASRNGNPVEPATVYFPESYADILSPGREMTVPCGRAIATNQDNLEGPEIHAEMFFVVTYRPKWVWGHKSERFAMEAKKTESGMWIWKSIPR